MFTRRDHVDPGVEQLLDVLPALLVARAGHVGVGELVDERDARACGRGPRRRPSPRTSRRGTRSAAAGRPRGRRSAPAVFGRPWVSTNPTTTSVPRSCAAPTLVEHREGLADAGRGAEVDAELAREPCAEPTSPDELTSTPVEREVELEHVDALLAEEAERCGRRCGRRSSSIDLGDARSRARRRRACAWRRALATEMCGSRPEPDAVTASTGHLGVRRRARSARGRPSRARPRRRDLVALVVEARLVGIGHGARVRRAEVRAEAQRRVVAGVGVRRRGRRAATGSTRERSPFSSANVWPMSVEPTSLPSTSMIEPFGLVGERRPGATPVIDERVARARAAR